MRLYVVSDLHLDAGDGARLFHDDRQGRMLSALCDRIAEEDAELVLLGDVFDFTAMTPPAHGLDVFGRAVGMPLEPKSAPSVIAMCQALREANPIALTALGRLAERRLVTLVPGNHDRHLAEPEAEDALASIGLGQVRLAPYVARRMGWRTVVLSHGHAFDSANASVHGGGEVLTGALHHAAIPFLRQHGARPNVRPDPNRLAALRPEERIFSVLQRWLDPVSFRQFLSAFLALLAANQEALRPLGWLASLVPTELVRSRIRREDDQWRWIGAAALAILGGRRVMPGGAPRPDVLVLGHTHVLDWAVESSSGTDRLYVNLGTWTDRSFDAVSPPDHSLPLLALRADGGEFAVSLRDLSNPNQEMQRYTAALG